MIVALWPILFENIPALDMATYNPELFIVHKLDDVSITLVMIAFISAHENGLGQCSIVMKCRLIS